MKKLSNGILWLIAGFMLFSCFEQPKTDQELFSAFYKDITNKATAIDAAFTPFGNALQNFDVDHAKSLAKSNIDEMITSWHAMQSIQVPSMANKEAEQNMLKAKEYLVSAYGYKVKIVDNFLESMHNGSLIQLQMGSTYADNYQSQSFSGFIFLTQAGQAVGVKVK